MSQGKNHGKGKNKTFASKRTMNPPQGDGSHRGDTPSDQGFQEQDAQRRLGSFEGKGEHARTPSRGHE
jgi:hypothetical protein